MTSYLLGADVVAQSYKDLRKRVVELLQKHGDVVGDIQVPHCPSWTIQMTLSHMIGGPEDILSGNMQGVTTEAWTDAQVARHQHHSITELLDIWESLADDIDAVVISIPEPVNSQFVFDATSHEHDIRRALDNCEARDTTAVEVSAGFVRRIISQHAHPNVQELLDSSVSSFDLLRCLSGRRTVEQIDACGLDADVVTVILSGMPVSIPLQLIEE